MKLISALAAICVVVFAAGPLGAQTVLINEVDSDTPGNDGAEFVELVSVGFEGERTGDFDLSGLVLVFVNGSNGQAYEAFDLDGFSTDARGFFVVGNPGVPNVELTFEPGSQGLLQNGEDAVALYMGDGSDFESNPVVDDTDLVDALVYESGSDTNSDLPAVLGFFGVIDDDGDTDRDPDSDPDGDGDILSISRIPDGGTALQVEAWTLKDPSPGVPNVPQNELTILIDMGTISENGGSATATVLVDSASADDLEVAISNSDPSELSVPETVVVPANAFMTTFPIGAVDDLWEDGVQTVTLAVSAPGSFGNSATIDVTDDDTGTGAVLVINEVLSAVDTFSGSDANQNGSTEASLDEFVEVVNVSASTVDLGGYMLKEFAALSGFTDPQHVFPEGTVLEPGCGLVVFGGGVVEGRHPGFGGALVQNGSSAAAGVAFGLDLSNAGDLVSLQNAAGVEVAGVAVPDASAFPGSYTRLPDRIGSFDFWFFTPGYESDGVTPLCPLPEALEVVVVPNPAQEGGPDGTVTVSVGANVAADTPVNLTSSAPAELSVPATLTVASGTNSASGPVSFPDDVLADGDHDVTVAATSNTFLTGQTLVTVEDDGDIQLVVINEILYEPAKGYDANGDGVASGTGDEFVEIANTSGAPLDLSGWKIGDAVVEERHVFPPGSVLPADCAIVVFGSGDPAGPFGGALVQTASSGQLGLNNNGDVVTLRDPAHAVVMEEAYSGSIDEQSINRSPELTMSAFVAHTGVAGAFDIASPGTFADGTPFCIPAEGTFASWALAHDVGDKLDDDDGDGIANLIEYALGLDPQVPDNGGLPEPVPDGNGQLTFTVQKGAEAQGDPGLTYSVEVSSDGSTWGPAPDGTVTETASTISFSSTSGSDVLMARVRVVCG